MVTTLEEYNNYYVNIINSHPYKVNEGEPYIQINLNTRTIDMQNMMNLGVLGDHNAETLWFQVDRYFDTMADLHIMVKVVDTYIDTALTGKSPNFISDQPKRFRVNFNGDN